MWHQQQHLLVLLLVQAEIYLLLIQLLLPEEQYRLEETQILLHQLLMEDQVVEVNTDRVQEDLEMSLQ